MSATEIHIFKLETTSTLTPGDIKAIKNRVKGYMRYSLICGCLSHSTTPPKDAARGGPGQDLTFSHAPDSSTGYKETRTEDQGTGPAPWLDEEAELTEALKP